MDINQLYPTESQRLIALLDAGSIPRPLPDASTSTVEAIQVKGRTVRGDHVIVTLERYSYRHYKGTYWTWRTMYAALDPEFKKGLP